MKRELAVGDLTTKQWCLVVLCGLGLMLLGACGANLVGTAHAQVPPTTCTRWEVQYFDFGSISAVIGKSIAIPSGWEPIGDNGTAAFFVLRRCIQ